MGFPADTAVKNLPPNAEGSSSIPGSGRSPGERNGHPLQYSLPGKSHGQRSLAGYMYSSRSCRRVGRDLTPVQVTLKNKDLVTKNKCTHRADSLFCAEETNTILKRKYTLIKKYENILTPLVIRAKQIKSPKVNQKKNQINELCYTHIIEYCSTIKRNKLLIGRKQK